VGTRPEVLVLMSGHANHELIEENNRQKPERHTSVEAGHAPFVQIGVDVSSETSISRPSVRMEGSNSSQPLRPLGENSSSIEAPPYGAGLLKTHQQHNKEIHAMVGNTTIVRVADEKTYGLVLVKSVETDTLKWKYPDQGGPGGAEQWKKYQTTYSDWWSAANVITAPLKSPFEVFPESVSFAGRIISLNYEKGGWANLLPVLMIIDSSNRAVPYNGEKEVNLTSNGLHWNWPTGIDLTACLLTSLDKNGRKYGRKEVTEIAAQTPKMIEYAKETLSNIKDALGKILNVKTALRKEGYKNVMDAYKVKVLLLDEAMKKKRAELMQLQQQFTNLLVERDAALEKYDPNHARKRRSMEEQLEFFGLSDLPLAAGSAQKKDIQPAAAFDMESPIDPKIMSFLDGT
jgi:hypothetical protein